MCDKTRLIGQLHFHSLLAALAAYRTNLAAFALHLAALAV